MDETAVEHAGLGADLGGLVAVPGCRGGPGVGVTGLLVAELPWEMGEVGTALAGAPS
ncbi:hypothetical protein ACWFRJ_39845 [Streptomyces sp. NPDC055239]